MENPLFDRYLTKTRQRIGMTVIHDADAVRRVPRALREDHAVAFLVDQGAVGLASTWVPFFGRFAKTPRGPAVFALRLGAPVVFGVALRQPDGRYVLGFEEVQVEPDRRPRGRRGPDRRRVHAPARALGAARARAVFLASSSLEASASRHSARTGRSRMNERVKRALRGDARAWFGVSVVVLLVLLAILAPLVAHHDPLAHRSRAPAAGAVVAALARHRHPGARRLGAARLRRAHLALRRHRLAGHRARARPHPRPHRRLLRQLGRRARDAPRRRHARLSRRCSCSSRWPPRCSRRSASCSSPSASSAGRAWRASSAARCSSCASSSSCRPRARSARATCASCCSTCCRTSSRRCSSPRRSASPARSWPKRRSRSSGSACSRRRRAGAR